jgi:hypothetical protein
MHGIYGRTEETVDYFYKQRHAHSAVEIKTLTFRGQWNIQLRCQ